MPPPERYNLTSGPFPPRKEFVFFPWRLYYGGWTWGTTYHRRVERGDEFPSGLTIWRVKDEYLTEAQAIMAKLEGEWSD